MKLFGTAGIRGDITDRVTPSLAVSVGQAVGADADEVVIGRDARTTGAALQSALEAGIASVGTTVSDAGVLPTPALAFAAQGRHGIMVTASHNPPTDNGIKVFIDGVEADSNVESNIERRVATQLTPRSWAQWTHPTTEDVLDEYTNHVLTYTSEIGSSPSALSVALDAGTGTAGLVLPALLTTLEVDVVALNANPDGHFPARRSKPTAKSLQDFSAFVEAGEYDIGLAHDGDADRIVVVDANGDLVHEDTILAILAEYYVQESDYIEPVVVTTPNASSRVDDRVEYRGGRVERCALGKLHEGVDAANAKARPQSRVVFAGEPWKHIHPASGGWIDGIVSAVVLCRLVASAGGLEPLREPVTERPYRKVNVECPEEIKSTVIEALESMLAETFEARIDTEYGIRIERDDGSWVLIRPSGTEPYIRIYVEADEVNSLTTEVTEIVENAVANSLIE